MMKSLNNLVFFCSHDICCGEDFETALICTLKERIKYDELNDEMHYNWSEKPNLNANIDNLDLIFFYRVSYIEEDAFLIIQKRFPNFSKIKTFGNSKEYYATTCPTCNRILEPKISSIELLDDDYWFEEIKMNLNFKLIGNNMEIPFIFFLINQDEFSEMHYIESFWRWLNKYNGL